MNLLQAAVRRKNTLRPPVWLMRQAGRYHSHYQALRARYSFIELCKLPEVACAATLGPIEDFDLDAAILFSDLLFPLEAMGMGLSYDNGPQLSFQIRDLADLKKIRGGAQRVEELAFQGNAIRLIRKQLDPVKGLLGFVGGPLTLFCYAVEGSHQGKLNSAEIGFYDGRYLGFVELLKDLLLENMIMQAHAGADAIAVLDTCAGEFSPSILAQFVLPSLKALLGQFREHCPETPVIYYSKKTGGEYWSLLKGMAIDCLGIDWNHDLSDVLPEWSHQWAIQGNIDPSWLLKSPDELEGLLRVYFGKIKALPIESRQGWICGLGHGVLPKTPEENVRLLLSIQKEIFSSSSSMDTSPEDMS
jgi:uroporphyrinogen decarboxylase